MDKLETLEDKLKKLVNDIDLDTIEFEEKSDEDRIDTKWIEKQKVFVWLRVYLKDEDPNIEIGDTVRITYEPSGEYIDTKFISYNKKGIDKDIAEQIQNYNPEDDKSTLVLMVDEELVNEGKDIPFIRTLFSFSKHYTEQVYRRNELVLSVESKDVILDYFDISF